MGGTDIRKNGSGYRDDTAFKAICNVTKAERRAKRHDRSNNKAHRNDNDRGACDPLDKGRNECTDDAGKLG